MYLVKQIRQREHHAVPSMKIPILQKWKFHLHVALLIPIFFYIAIHKFSLTLLANVIYLQSIFILWIIASMPKDAIIWGDIFSSK